jgi:hypothetical protein
MTPRRLTAGTDDGHRRFQPASASSRAVARTPLPFRSKRGPNTNTLTRRTPCSQEFAQPTGVWILRRKSALLVRRRWGKSQTSGRTRGLKQGAAQSGLSLRQSRLHARNLPRTTPIRRSSATASWTAVAKQSAATAFGVTSNHDIGRPANPPSPPKRQLHFIVPPQSKTLSRNP